MMRAENDGWSIVGGSKFKAITKPLASTIREVQSVGENMGSAASHRSRSKKQPEGDSVSDRVRLDKNLQSSPSSSSNNPEHSNEAANLSNISQTNAGDRPIVAIAHRYQRSWKSRLAASMRQARDFLSRPRMLARNYSSRRHNAPSREELLRNDVKLDINIATKHELQRLPGIDGSLASAIIEHRKLLVGGRFKRLDDLVNVPGLDVEKLNRIREFIQISKVKTSASGDSLESKPSKTRLNQLQEQQASNNHNNSPTASEGQPTVVATSAATSTTTTATTTIQAPTVTLSPSYSGPRLSADACLNHANGTPALLNINKATEEDFVNVAGVPESVAKKIVMARQNAGPFHSVDDIKRIKGVSKSLFTKVYNKLTVEDSPSQHKAKLIPPGITLSASTGNFRPSIETDSGVATTISIIAGGSSSGSNAGGPPSNGGLATGGSAASASTSKQVSPDSTVREMDINNLPDVIIKYTKPSDLELIQKLQMNTQNAGRGRGRGFPARGHSRNISDFGVIADYTDICSPVYPSDMHGIRPIVEPFDFRAASEPHQPVVRFAFWDLEDCGMEKISNPGVLETICMTILENGVSIAAFTDLLDAGVVDRIADQLTWPSLHCVREWRGGRGSWRSAVVKTGYCSSTGSFESEPRSRTSSGGSSADIDGERQPIYCGFVYDTSRSIEMVSRCHYLSPLQQPASRRQSDDAHDLIGPRSPHPECLNVALPKTTLHRLAYRPAAAKFSLSTSSSAEDGIAGGTSYLAVVCLKLSPDDSAFFRRRDIALSTAPLLSAVLEAVSTFGENPQQQQPSTASDGSRQQTSIPIILAGSFGVDAGERCFDLLRVAGYQLASNDKTNINRKQPNGTICGDQVWVADVGAASSAYRQFTGRAGVVRKALTHPQIPDGWAWGGLVSSHCPVWAEFFAVPQSCEKNDEKKKEEPNE